MKFVTNKGGATYAVNDCDLEMLLKRPSRTIEDIDDRIRLATLDEVLAWFDKQDLKAPNEVDEFIKPIAPKAEPVPVKVELPPVVVIDPVTKVQTPVVKVK